MQLSSDLLMNTVQTLEHHEEAQRIKKLIFCLCKKYWENDLNILNSFSLSDLLQELIQTKPTIEQLTFSMYKLVKTLNRPKVYANVAKVILEETAELYAQITPEIPEESTVLSFPEQDSEEDTREESSEQLIDQIVTSLSQNPEESRIKKLIFSVCKNRWENNIQVIENYGFKDLILETCQVYPTKNDLENALTKIVDNINKQTLYLAVANIIIKTLDSLYEKLEENLDIESIPPDNPPEQTYDTQIVPVKSPAASNRNSEYETSIIDLSEQMVTELRKIQAATVKISAQKYDLFELRQTIMQYTNPLRAKILLFSVLFHPWDRSGQDWSMLRSYTLDDLIEQLILCGKGFPEIDAKLQSTARSLSEPDAQLQTASTIIEAIKPFV